MEEIVYQTKEELLKAYSNWDVEEVSETLYYIHMRLFRMIKTNKGFKFESLE